MIDSKRSYDVLHLLKMEVAERPRKICLRDVQVFRFFKKHTRLFELCLCLIALAELTQPLLLIQVAREKQVLC